MSTRRPRHLGRRRDATGGDPVPTGPATPPAAPEAELEAPAPLTAAPDERPGRGRSDTSAILRSLIADVVDRPAVGDVGPAGDAPEPRAAGSAAATATVAQPLDPQRLVLPQRPLLPLTAPGDLSEPVVASHRADPEDDGGPEATIRGAVLLALLLGVTVVSAIITYLTLRP